MPEILSQLFQYIIHMDHYLNVLLANYGLWIYLILFFIIFCETGLVVTPFLPGDSLLFAAGTLTALGHLNIHFLVISLIVAAILGDTVNYAIGKWLGPRVFNHDQARFLNKKYLQQAHAFYKKYGGKTIIIARFIPIIRTFAPFVAGIAAMDYKHFLQFNVLGAVLWVSLITYSSYWFGTTGFVQQHFSSVILAIIMVSLLPPLLEYWRARRS